MPTKKKRQLVVKGSTPYGAFTLNPIKVVVYNLSKRPYLGIGFGLEMLSALITTQRGFPAVRKVSQPVHQRLVPEGPLVPPRTSLKSPTLTPDKDRPVSRRSKPNSRIALIGEQPNPWELLHPQDATSRHRGAEQGR